MRQIIGLHVEVDQMQCFYSKISIVIEEADESLFWLEMLTEAGIVKAELLVELRRENEEIIKIMVIARKHSEKPK